VRSSESASAGGAITVHKKDDTDCKSAAAGDRPGRNIGKPAENRPKLTNAGGKPAIIGAKISVNRW